MKYIYATVFAVAIFSIGISTAATIKVVKMGDIISAQRTLIESQRGYISTADEFTEIQTQRIEACESKVLR